MCTLKSTEVEMWTVVLTCIKWSVDCGSGHFKFTEVESGLLFTKGI